MLKARVPISRRVRPWRGDRAAHCNVWALYWRDVCERWRVHSAARAGSLAQPGRRKGARGTRKPRHTVHKEPHANKHRRGCWIQWSIYCARARSAWRNDAALRARWHVIAEQFAGEHRECREPHFEVAPPLTPERTLWQAGDAHTPVRLHLLEEHVCREHARQTAPLPRSHPMAASTVPGATRVARHLTAEQDRHSAVGDPLPPGKLPKLDLPRQCWQQHLGLCRWEHRTVHPEVLHVQANLNTLFAGGGPR